MDSRLGTLEGKLFAMTVVDRFFRAIEGREGRECLDDIKIHYEKHRLHELCRNNNGFWIEFPHGGYIAFGNTARHHRSQCKVENGLNIHETWYILKEVWIPCEEDMYLEEGHSLIGEKHYYLAIGSVLNEENLKKSVLTLLCNLLSKIKAEKALIDTGGGQGAT